MEQQSNGNNPNIPFEKQQEKINGNSIITMQNMEANAASIRIKNRRRQQMIYIYQHCREHHKIGFLPIFSEK